MANGRERRYPESVTTLGPTLPDNVHREPESASNDQQEDQAKEHAHIRARFAQRAPKAVLHERDDLGRVQGHANVDEQGHAGKADELTSQEQRAASDLGDSNERGHELWQGNADLRKAAHSQRFWKTHTTRMRIRRTAFAARFAQIMGPTSPPYCPAARLAPRDYACDKTGTRPGLT